MFTGIIEEVGKVLKLEERHGTKRLTVSSRKLVRELKKGASIAVSGVCLTAVEIHRDRVRFDLAAETIARTSFARLRPGALVNLELPVKYGERMGGHVVQGHVDGVGKFLGLERIAGADDYWLRVQVPKDLAKYVAFKGSISIEGISLTVAKIQGTTVTVAIIPHTMEATNLGSLKKGDPVNLEADVLAKYAEKMLAGEEAPGGVTLERLVAEGF
ncbi:MAG TPA: riboflavin synthase [Terriglobales bacterium]|jgi:riboflavin synthase|nr:riboflavin synthase [Terriglobales bacterium]